MTGRASALKTLRFDETMWSSEDFEYWLRLTAAGYKIGYHRSVLVRYRKRATSLSADTTSMAKANLKVLTKAMSFWPDSSAEVGLLRDAIARKTAELAILRAKLALKARDTASAIEHLEQANLVYKSAKLRGVVALVRYAPALVRGVSALRERMMPAYRGTN